ncbi:MAG: isopentenyl phosphate kinase family protein [Chloroflexi bacterium]|nr:isopentenyl phosphate kinase family protein [Chloroflexota bacterium]
MEPVTYLKLGGSLITNKKMPHTPRLEIIERAVTEIKDALAQADIGKLVIGHGSGSFGHVPAKKYQTRDGVYDPAQWQGFVEVWNEAHALNQILVEAFAKTGLPVMAFPPSAMIITDHGRIHAWNLEPILKSVEKGIIPLVQGDVVFDLALGGTILSTEEIFAELANHLPPSRVLLAGVEKGVWQDFPKHTKLIHKIGINNFSELNQIAGGAEATDVTGGMLEKIRVLMNIIDRFPQCKGLIFSGMETGSIERALLGETPGTLVSSN